MTIAQTMLPEFDIEMANTRKLLERVPLDTKSWKPHEKSMSLGKLAGHVATIPSYGHRALTKSEWNFAVPDGEERGVPDFKTREEMLARFDAEVKRTREALVGVEDAALMQKWTLRNGDHVVFTLPRTAVWRTFMMNHLIHHRAQLGVYLRLNGVPIPGMYGPSADEP
jgi:uncharacterized damage-inducible protein DinB